MSGLRGARSGDCTWVGDPAGRNVVRRARRVPAPLPRCGISRRTLLLSPAQMLLRSETVEQTIDGEQHGKFVNDILMLEGEQPLGMVRKRLLGLEKTRGTVMLIHGFGQNRHTWHTTHRSFSAYLAAAGWDVFNAELRGHGRSRRFGSSRPRLLDDYIRLDLPAFVDEALRLSGHDQLFLIGHSMGGLIAYSVAGTTLRDRVRGVVSLGSPYRFGRGSHALGALSVFADAVRFTGLLDQNPPMPLRWVGNHLRKRAAVWDLKGLPTPIRAWRPGSVERDVLDDYLKSAFDPTSLAVALDIVRAGQEASLKSLDGLTDYGVAFEMLARPLLVIAGTLDTLAPPESVRPAYELSRSRDKTYREFPAGHVDLVIGREAPVTSWPLVRQWLARR